jgi:hypothetical protein
VLINEILTNDRNKVSKGIKDDNSEAMPAYESANGLCKSNELTLK